MSIYFDERPRLTKQINLPGRVARQHAQRGREYYHQIDGAESLEGSIIYGLDGDLVRTPCVRSR